VASLLWRAALCLFPSSTCNCQLCWNSEVLGFHLQYGYVTHWRWWQEADWLAVWHIWRFRRPVFVDIIIPRPAFYSRFFPTLCCEKTIKKPFIHIHKLLSILIIHHSVCQPFSPSSGITKTYKVLKRLMKTVSFVKRNEIFLHKGYISTRMHITDVILKMYVF